MKRLENIPKKNIFQVPDGYFEKLPMAIQGRLEAQSPALQTPYFRYALQYALPVLILVVVAIVVLRPQSTPSVESMLSSVSTEELIAYLEETTLTTDELLENFNFDDSSAEAIEQEIYFQYEIDSTELDLITNEIEFDLPNF